MYTEEKPQMEIFSKNLRRILADKDMSQSELSRFTTHPAKVQG